MTEKRKATYPFDVGFTYFDGERWIEDETQFDLDLNSFGMSMMTQIAQLFRKFCDENHFSPAFMTYVEQQLPW